MCAEQGGEVNVVKALVFEKLRERVCGGIDIGQKTWRRLRGRIFAANVGLHTWNTWAGNDCVGAGEDWNVSATVVKESRSKGKLTNHVCDADLVLISNRLEICADTLKTIVLR